MKDQREVIAFYDERMLDHAPDMDAPFLPTRLDRRVREMLASIPARWRYPEQPGRLQAIYNLLQQQPVPQVSFEPGRPATCEQLARVHTSTYLDHIFSLRGKNAWLDMDTTAVSSGSVDAAEVAAGTAIAAVEAVLQGRASSAFALVRPPGHHAESVRARGFCLFNNIAVAAAHARAVLGCQRVLIIDWDAHHGNGTQEIFHADEDVLFFDSHRAAPFYPGSGALEDIGVGLGEGCTVNVPLPSGSGDTAILKAFREILVPAADYFRPDLVLVSAGFDAHRFDLAMNVSHEGFAAMTAIVQDIADRHCNGHLAMVLEGGYNLDSLSQGVRTVLQVLAGKSVDEPQEFGIAEVDAAIEFHRTAFMSEQEEDRGH